MAVGKESLATKITNRVSSCTELFHSPDRIEFVSFSAGGHRETHPVKSAAFRHYLRRLAYRMTGKVPSASAINDIINMCAAVAFDGATHPVFLRVGEADGCLWLDLGDPDWVAIRVSSAGWTPVLNPPIRFRRPPGALELPMPQSGGTVGELRSFINVESDEDFCLLLCWLCAAFRPCGPFPVLTLHGEQGSAKSTLSRVLRELVDPYKAPIRSAPHEEEDLLIAANNSHMVCFDNMSHIEPWLSDALCRMATGGGMSKRELYTDMEEVIIECVRPVILNGIEDLASRGDLADRSIVVYLPAITAEARQQERDLWSAFQVARPRILGSLLDVLAGALRNIENGITLTSKPRMADFAVWAVACESPLGFPSRTFLQAYEENRVESTRVVLDTPFADAVCTFARKQSTWEGTAAEMMKELDPMSTLAAKDRLWPKTARGFASALRRLAPNLRTVGVRLIFGKREAHTGRRIIYLSYSEPTKDEEQAAVAG